MKILHIVYSGLGGHGNVFFSMADADIEKENQYEVIFFGIEEARISYIEKAVARKIPWYCVKKKPGTDFNAYRQIEKIIIQTLPDIVFLHSSAYIFPVKKAMLTIHKKIKIIVRETQPNHLKTKLEWIGLSFALLFADKVVFLSNEYRDAIKKQLKLFFSGKRTAVIPNGIDLNVYKPARKDFDSFIRIGMQSRLSATKDHVTLLKAFHFILNKKIEEREIVLLIAGDGDCRAALEKQALDLGLGNNIIFLGMLEETALPAFINSLDIYVHATLGETMSTAIMQVMACKMPIVASDVLGVNNMIKHNYTGLLVPPKNEKAMADAILHLLNNSEDAVKLSNNAFDFAVANYSNKLMFEKYETVFSE